MLLTIVRSGDKYDYSIDEDSGTESDTCGSTLNQPILVLNGDFIQYVELNSPYGELGAKAETIDGDDISFNINISAYDNIEVDTSTLGTYLVVYSVTSGGSTATLTRTVSVRDTTSPILVKPGAVQLMLTDTTYDYMNGVSATDNDEQPVTITATNNILFGVAGNYYITYTATDTKGNKTVERRLVVIE
jgi:hypothetical protein